MRPPVYRVTTVAGKVLAKCPSSIWATFYTPWSDAPSVWTVTKSWRTPRFIGASAASSPKPTGATSEFKNVYQEFCA